jgi:uncharacterized membrane protein YcaP (DUF421 family)
MIATFFSTLFTAIIAYGFIILLLKVSGKRTLSRMNTFDLIVVVALGSILARTILSGGALFQGLFALSILAGLQFGLEWLSAKDPRVRRMVTSEPSLIFHKGVFLRKAMTENRISEQDVFAAIRQSGFDDISSIDAVVLESNGDVSVIPRNMSASNA